MKNTTSITKRTSHTGFTLLEILVTVFIFGIILTTIFGSFQTVFGSRESIEQHMAQYEAAKSCLNRIISDINGLYISLPPMYKLPENTDIEDPYRVVGEIDFSEGEQFSRLRFTSNAHLPFEAGPQNGIAQIVYYVKKTENNSYVLQRSDTLYPYPPLYENQDKNTDDPMLCENLMSFSILFYDTDGAVYESWDSDDEELGYATPRAIKIKIAIGNDEADFSLETLISLPVYREKKA